MNITHHKTLSIIAGIMLILAIPSIWSYSYYQTLRWVVCGVAVCNGYSAYNAQKKNWVFIMGAIAILFNPISPIFLDKGIWVFIDVITAVIMFVSIKKINPNG